MYKAMLCEYNYNSKFSNSSRTIKLLQSYIIGCNATDSHVHEAYAVSRETPVMKCNQKIKIYIHSNTVCSVKSN